MEAAEGASHESLQANDSTEADILGRSFLSGGWGSGLVVVGTSARAGNQLFELHIRVSCPNTSLLLPAPLFHFLPTMPCDYVSGWSSQNLCWF